MLEVAQFADHDVSRSGEGEDGAAMRAEGRIRAENRHPRTVDVVGLQNFPRVYNFSVK